MIFREGDIMENREEKVVCSECGAEWRTLTRYFDTPSEDELSTRSVPVTHVTEGTPCQCAARAAAAKKAAEEHARRLAADREAAEFARLAALPDADPDIGIEDEDCSTVGHMLHEMRDRAKIDAMMSGVEGTIRAVQVGDRIKFLNVERRAVICARYIGDAE